MRPSLLRWSALAGCAVVLLSGCTSPAADAQGPLDCTPTPVARVVPADGALIGVNVDWGTETLAEYGTALGTRPAVAVSFATTPFTAEDAGFVDQAVEQVQADGGVLLLTLEPTRGLAAVTDAVVADLVRRLDGWNRRGVPVLVRFAHEMNGSWYPWAQQPAAYVATFRRVAAAVHAGAPGSGLMWAPNYGGGHPFTGGRYAAVAGSPDAAALDTDGDGTVTGADDPYAPYWPGDDAVDWVGMSLYHWGGAYPWGENEVPEPGKFVAQLTGEYAGLGGDDRGLPDFHAVYGEQHGKPVAVPETAALYAPTAGGAGEQAVKQSWWRQVFDPAVAQRLPRLRMVNWFEWSKDEPEVGTVVDWRALGSPDLRRAYRDDLPGWARWADAVPGCRPAS